MNFRLSYFFTVFLAGLLTFGCGSDPEPDPKPELSILVQPSDKNPLSEGLFVGGQDIMLTASVSHTGGPGSEATQLQFYRSEDAAISTDDSPEGERPVEALSSGASVDVNITVTLPSEVGSYYYGACITVANSYKNCSPGLEIIVSEVTRVTPGSMTNASLPAGGSNYFQFTLESTQGMAIHTSGETDVTGRLYDGDGALVAANFNSGESGNFRLDRPLVSGTYFIRVSGNDMSTAGGYTLHLEGSHVTTVEPVSMTDRILAAGGSDYFQFTLESTQFLVIYSSGTTFTTGRLYDSSGVPLATDFNRGGDGNFRIDRPLAPGTYFLRVHGAFQSVMGDYTLHVEGGGITTIEPGSTAEGTLTNSRRYSHFQFTLESAQGLAIYTSGGVNTTGRLYDRDRVTLAADFSRSAGGNFRIDHPLTPGTYFIEVGGGHSSAFGDYTLHVEGASITTLTPGSMTDGILAAGDSDYFQLTLEGAQSLAVYTSGERNTTGSLYDARGTLLATDENSGEGDHFRIERILTPGTYFIRVSGSDMNVAGGYTLHVEGASITTVTPGSMTESTLPAVGRNYFRLTLESAQFLTIYTSGSIDIFGRLYDSNGALLATDENSGANFNFRIERFLSPGTYFIQVSGAHSSTAGDYTLHVEEETTVTPGSMTESTLPAVGRNYFRLALESAQFLTIYTSGSIDIFGRLYDSNGALLATDDDSGANFNFRIERILTPGTYFIQVSGAHSSTAGDYTLHVEGRDTTVTPDSMTESSLLAGGSSSYFRFTLESAQFLTIYTSGSIDIFGRLYDSNGTLLATDENSGANFNFRIERILTPGTYFIQVSGAHSSTAGDYTLHVEVLDITTATALTLPEMAGDTETSNQTPTPPTDYFRLQIETPRTLEIWSERSGGAQDALGITMYDADLNILVNPGDDEDSGSDFRISREFTPGTYLLAVSVSSDSLPYKIHIRWEVDDG